MRLNLGCGISPKAGYVNLDIVPGKGVDLVWDLNQVPWPVTDASCEEVHASHVFEHLESMPRTVAECARVLCDHGILNVTVPHYRSENAFTDPTHVRFFTPRTFDYWCPTPLHDAYPHSFPLVFRKLDVSVGYEWRRLRFPRRPAEIRFSLERVPRH